MPPFLLPVCLLLLPALLHFPTECGCDVLILSLDSLGATVSEGPASGAAWSNLGGVTCSNSTGARCVLSSGQQSRWLEVQVPGPWIPSTAVFSNIAINISAWEEVGLPGKAAILAVEVEPVLSGYVWGHTLAPPPALSTVPDTYLVPEIFSTITQTPGWSDYLKQSPVSFRVLVGEGRLTGSVTAILQCLSLRVDYLTLSTASTAPGTTGATTAPGSTTVTSGTTTSQTTGAATSGAPSVAATTGAPSSTFALSTSVVTPTTTNVAANGPPVAVDSNSASSADGALTIALVVAAVVVTCIIGGAVGAVLLTRRRSTSRGASDSPVDVSARGSNEYGVVAEVGGGDATYHNLPKQSEGEYHNVPGVSESEKESPSAGQYHNFSAND
jgi:hypothetical protein